jgi:hypothetical protein
MVEYIVRACCADAPEGVGFTTAPGEEPRPRTGEVIARLSEPPRLAPGVAAHEASHGVVAIVLGGGCDRIVLGHQPHAATRIKGLLNQIATFLAGPLAQRLSLGHLALEPVASLRDVISRVEACGGGSCDQCESARRASLLAPLDDKPAMLDLIQKVEFQTLQIVRDPDVRAAISEVADALEERGEIGGAEVHSICDLYGVTGRFQIDLPPKSE